MDAANCIFISHIFGHCSARPVRLNSFRDFDFQCRTISLPWITGRLLEQLITHAVVAGLVKPTDSAIDGTSVRSRGSRHRVVNQKTLRKLPCVELETQLLSKLNRYDFCAHTDAQRFIVGCDGVIGDTGFLLRDDFRCQ